MKQNNQFTITKDHLKLLKIACIDWVDCECGAAGIDCKRPYGSSYMLGDIAEAIGIKSDDGDFTREQEDYMYKLHSDMQNVLQIACDTLKIELGNYKMNSKYKWEKINK